MKIHPLALLPLLTLRVFAQGPLLPPSTVDPKIGPVAPLTGGGVPQPTMKTLHQVEPRIPLVAGSPGVVISGGGNITINLPGSYYLTSNLTVASGDGIWVFTPSPAGVTLDLNGFTISSTSNPASGNGILCSTGITSVAIMNGHVVSSGTIDAAGAFSGAGFDTGIHANALYQVRISDIHVRGVQSNGIYCDLSTIASTARVENCSVRHCGQIGIRAVDVSSCNVIDTRSNAIFAQSIRACTGRSLAGIAIRGSRVTDCSGETTDTTVSGAGISADIVVNSTGIAPSASSAKPIVANIAVACISYGPANSIVNRYNMPASP